MSEVDESEMEMEVDHPGGKENVRKLTRGEKSKIAAKGRRDKEQIAMLDLMKELPVSDEVLQKMDKASVVKLATCYLKVKHFVQKDIALYGHKALTNGSTPKENNVTALQTKNHSAVGNVKEGKLILEALNGFLIFVNRKGSIKFVSNTIEDHLGLKQEYLLGKNVFEYIHENDQQELHKQFTEDKKVDKANTYSSEDEPQRVFYLRMKFNLPKPGSKTKHTGFMLVQWSGKMKRHISMKQGTVVTDGLLCICRPMQTTPILEIRMDGNMFMSRHDLGMTFTFCDTRILTLIGYEPSEVIGKTAYHFHNPIDAPKVGDCHQNLIIKGTSVSKYYRFLGKTDNWVWLQTRATIIYNTANKPQYIVCMNYVISEEEGERYLMLEEHQQANQHTEYTVLTLPDNQPTVFHASCCQTSGPKIVELEEENLEKTACFNGELDQPQVSDELISSNQQQSTDHLSSNSMVSMTGFQQNSAGPAPALVPPLQAGVPLSSRQSAMGNQEISQQQQPIVASLPGLTNAPSAGGLENNSNTTIIDPQVPDYVQACSPEGSAGTYASSLCFPHAGDQYNSGMGDQNMAPSCSSSHSEDAGYESATSPYNGSYFSPQMVSPGCNYNDTDRDQEYTPNINNPRNLIQGQNCSFGIGYGSMPQNNVNILQGESSMDVLDTTAEFPNPILDEILQSLNQPTSDSLDVNMALVYSSIESLTSNSTAAVSTSMKGPVANTYEYLKGSAKATVPNNTMTFQANKPAGRTDKPLLRSFLTMPQEALPSQPPGGFLQMLNKNGEKAAFSKGGKPVPCVLEKQVNTSAQVQNHSSQTCRGNSVTKLPGSASENGPLETMDNSESLDFDEIPEYALQYLVNDITDAQAQALIADLQGDGDLQNDSFMDTSESDFAKQFVSSLENQSLNANTGSENLGYKTVNGPLMGNNIPYSQCRTSCFNLGNGMKCNATQGQNSNFGFKGNSVPSTNYQSSNSGHDHVYHQSVSRLNGQNRPRCHKSPENRSMYFYNRVNGGQSTCHSQTQTSEHCMSELERHLRNKLTSKATSCSEAHERCVNSEKPFLQQLLTGELTNDMYMKMERKRFEDKHVMPK